VGHWDCNKNKKHIRSDTHPYLPPSLPRLPLGVVSCALGMAGLFLAFLLACNSIKNKERKHVTGLLASLMFFQFIGALVRSLPPSLPPYQSRSPPTRRRHSHFLPPTLPHSRAASSPGSASTKLPLRIWT